MAIKHSPGCRCCEEGGVCCNQIQILDPQSQVQFDTSYIQSGSVVQSPQGYVTITGPLVLSVPTCCPDWVIEMEFYDTGDDAFVKVDRALQFTTTPYTNAYTPAYKIGGDTYETPCLIDEADRPKLTYQWYQSRLSKDYKLPWTCDSGFPDNYEFDKPPFATIGGQPIYRYALLNFVSVFDSEYGCQREGVYGLNYLSFPDDPAAWSRGGAVPLSPRTTPITINPGSSTMVLNKLIVKYGSQGLASDLTQDCSYITAVTSTSPTDYHTGDPVYLSSNATASYQYFDGLWDAAIIERYHLRTDDDFIPDSGDFNRYWQPVAATSFSSPQQIVPSASDASVSVSAYAADISKFEQDSYVHGDVLPDLWKIYYDRLGTLGPKSWLQINLTAVDQSYQNTFTHNYASVLYDWERIGSHHLYFPGGMGPGYELRQHTAVREGWIESVTIVDNTNLTTYSLSNALVSYPSGFDSASPSQSGCLANTVYSYNFAQCPTSIPFESKQSIQYPVTMTSSSALGSPAGYSQRSNVVRMSDGTDDWFVAFEPTYVSQPLNFKFSARRESDCLFYFANNNVQTTLVHSCGSNGLITTNLTDSCNSASITVVWRIP